MARRTPSPTSRPHTREDRENRHQETLLRWGIFERCFKSLVWGGTISLCVYLGIYLPVKASAGAETTISYVLQWVGDLKADVYLAWCVAAAAGIYGTYQRNRRMNERRDKDLRIEELEKRFDPERTSSNLTVEGKPRENKP